MKLLFTFYNHGNYTKIKNGRNFAKKNFFRHKTYSRGDLLQWYLQTDGSFYSGFRFTGITNFVKHRILIALVCNNDNMTYIHSLLFNIIAYRILGKAFILYM